MGGSLGEWMVALAFLLLVLCIVAWALWPRRRAVPAQSPRQQRATSRQVVPAHVALSAFVGHLVVGLRDMRSTYHRVVGDSAMSTQDDDVDADDLEPETPAFRPQKQETGSRKQAEADVSLGKKRVQAVVKMAQAGMDEDAIMGVVNKEPEALKAALKHVTGRWVGYAMVGNYQDNMQIVGAIVEQAQEAEG